jgi:hypothetical protein
MYEELYRYLIHYKQLPLPGVGTILLERKPASIDFPNKQLHPPGYRVILQQASLPPSKGFYNWLAGVLHISERDAVVRFNDFVFEIRQSIARGAMIDWKGVGVFNKGLGGDIRFVPAVKNFAFEQPLPAEKVIRYKAEHMVRVGEEEKTSVEMAELLSQPAEKKSYWWAWSLVLALAALTFIGWYFSEKGVSVASAGNGRKLAPQETAPTHTLRP